METHFADTGTDTDTDKRRHSFRLAHYFTYAGDSQVYSSLYNDDGSLVGRLQTATVVLF